MTIKAEDFVVEGLTDDEREALTEAAAEDAAEVAEGDAKTAATLKGDADDDTADADVKAADAAPKVDAAKKADDKPADKVEAKPAETADETAAKPAETKPEVSVEPKVEQPRHQRQAVPDWQAPADADAKLAEIATARDALGEKFNNGEIDGKQLLAEQSKLARQEREIERAIDRAEMSVQMSQAAWLQGTVPAFLNTNEHYKTNATLHSMLDAQVRRLQVEAGQAGKDPLDPAILTAADAAIRESLGAFGVKPAAPAAKAIAAKAGRPEIPPTLGSVPAAGLNETGDGGRFAGLDRLADSNPEAYEAAYAKLSEAERDAYLTRH